MRNLVKVLKKKADIVIDELTTDDVTVAGYDLKQAEKRTARFREFIETNKNELLALQILYSQPYPKRRLTYAAIKDLAQRLTDPPYHLTTADVWQGYKRLQAALVRGAPSDKVLTDIISLVRFATGQIELLEPYAARVEQRFNLWIGRQIKAGPKLRRGADDLVARDQGLSGRQRGNRVRRFDARPPVHRLGRCRRGAQAVRPRAPSDARRVERGAGVVIDDVGPLRPRQEMNFDTAAKDECVIRDDRQRRTMHETRARDAIWRSFRAHPAPRMATSFCASSMACASGNLLRDRARRTSRRTRGFRR